MCGIVGYVGNHQAKDFLLSGLEKLEYRGYDSAGICVIENGTLKCCKAKGRLKALKEKANHTDLSGSLGVGHTRWATHGAPTERNAHPHFSQDGRFAVVHNGIIENYPELKLYLTQKGFSFASDTDTEAIAHLLAYHYHGDVLDAFFQTVSMLKGSYALEVLSAYTPDRVFATAKESPLIVGIGQGETFVASDIPAMLAYTRNVYLLQEGEFAVLTKDAVTFLDKEKQPVSKEKFQVDWDVAAAEKDGYDFFMMKEIMQQPKAIRDTVFSRIDGDKIDFSDLSLSDAYIDSLRKIHILACGSAYHVGLAAKQVLEGVAGVSTAVEIASEFRYRNPVIQEGDLAVAISQSGETLDTLAALEYAKARGAKTISIVNVQGSSIARASDDVLYTNAGPEIAVATTKAYSAQLSLLLLFGFYIAEKKGVLSFATRKAYMEEWRKIPENMEKLLSDTAVYEKLSKHVTCAKNVFFIGRGIDYTIAMEGALKLKEISYIHSEAFAAGELKHGTISLIEKGTLVVALASQEHLLKKMLSNIREVKARGAFIIGVTQEGSTLLEREVDEVIYIPKARDCFAAALEAIPLQLLAYFVARDKGLDVDKPRNLAKSVTVE